MPPSTPATRPDLALLVAHYRDLFGLRDWTITARWVEPEEIPGAFARILPLPERKLAEMLVSTAYPDEQQLRETIAHELGHALISPLANIGEWSAGALMIEEQIVEALSLAIVRAEKLPAEAAVMRRALANLPARIRARLSARPTHMRSRMDATQVLEAIKGQDGAAALALLDAYLVDLLKGAAKEAGIPDEEAAPLEGEAPAAMMRRVLTKALARKAAPGTLSDTGFSAKVLKRLGVDSEADALLRIAALKIADTQVEDLSAVEEMRARKGLVLDAMKRTGLGRSAFYADGADELLDEWREGTVEQVKRTLATLKRGGSPITRSRVEPDPAALTGGAEIPEAVRRHAERRGRGGDVEYMKRLAREFPNGGAMPQES